MSLVDPSTALAVDERYRAAGLSTITLVSPDHGVNTAAEGEGLAAENPKAL